jgi:hypothetical protein
MTHRLSGQATVLCGLATYPTGIYVASRRITASPAR